MTNGLVAFIGLACACGMISAAFAGERTQVVDRGKLSIAKVTTAKRDGKVGIGTAFLIDSRPSVAGKDPKGPIVREKGYLLTNCHVVSDAIKVEIQFMNLDPNENHLREAFPMDAQVRGCDDWSDLAVLEFGPNPAESGLFRMPPLLRFANPKDIRVGDEVLTLGFAMNLGGNPSVNAGIISALNRSFAGGRSAA